jgi:hypothetical protein
MPDLDKLAPATAGRLPQERYLKMANPELVIGIRDWFAWKPGMETRAAWLRWAGAPPADEVPSEENNPKSLPMMLRRRMNGFGQQVVGTALATGAAQQSRYIFATRHGEFTTTLRILEEIRNRAAPSPADFSMSVHHALAGLLSIHTGNKAGHTTISAGANTFGYGVLEAATTILEQQHSGALLVSYDEPLPDAYQGFGGREEEQSPFIVALDIVEPEAADHRFMLSIRPNGGTLADEFVDRQGSLDVSNSLDMPMGQRFLDFFLSGRSQAELVGETLTWMWRRVD